jgi:hypothetical protein
MSYSARAHGAVVEALQDELARTTIADKPSLYFA